MIPGRCWLLATLGLALLLFAVGAIGEDGPCVVDHSPMSLVTFHLPSAGTPRDELRAVSMQPVEDTLAKLRQISGKVAAVAIAGEYRSGKSTVLNRLLPQSAGHHGAFGVGGTTEAHTQDVQIHLLPLCALKGQGIDAKSELSHVLFLDTPGLYSPDRPAVFDSQLLALLNVIASVVLYNSNGVIQTKDITSLSEAMNNAFLMSFFSANSTSQGPERSSLDRPDLFWLFQDFTLSASDTPKEYILRNLKRMDAGDAEAGYQDRFMRFFNNIDGQYLPHPVEHTKDLGSVDTVKWEDLDEQYRIKIGETRTKLLRSLRPKKVANVDLTGELFVSMLRTWMEVMKVGLPDLRPDSTKSLMEGIIKREVINAREKYRQLLDGLSYPMSWTTLSDKSRAFIDDLIKGKEPIAEFVSDARKAFDAELEAFRERNRKALKALHQKQFDSEISAAITEAKEALDDIKPPVTEALIEGVHKKLMTRWAAFIAGGTKEASDAATPFELQLKSRWHAIRRSVEDKSQQLEQSACLKYASAFAARFAQPSWLSNWITADEFESIEQSLKANDCSKHGLESPEVLDQLDLARHSFMLGHRMQTAVAILIGLVVYAIAIYALTRLPTLYSGNFEHQPHNQLRKMLNNEGQSPVIFSGAAFTGLLLGYVAADAIWNWTIHLLLIAALCIAAGLGFALRCRVRNHGKGFASFD